MTNSIIFQENNDTGTILLNNPEALNALDLEMAELFFSKLSQWQNNNNIKIIQSDFTTTNLLNVMLIVFF